MAAGGAPPRDVRVRAERADASRSSFDARVRIDTPDGGRVLPPRRHPAVRAAPAARRDEPQPRARPHAKRQRAARGAGRAARRAPRLLLDLLEARGPSGYEARRRRTSGGAAAGEFARGQHRLVGTPLALVRAAAGGAERHRRRRLLVMGHIDEIGLIVTHIDDDGYLWFREVGGWDPQILVGQRVVIDTRDGPGARASWDASRSTCCATRSARRSPRSARCTSTSARATARRRARWCASATSP